MLQFAHNFTILALLIGQTPAAAPTADDIARAIDDLGAETFDARQAATDLLWRAGQAAEPALAQAAKSTDPEVRTRAMALLNKLRLGIRPDTPPELLALVDQFRYAPDANQRRQALNELQAKGHWQTVLTLIRGEKNPQERRNLATALGAEAGKIVSSLVDKGELSVAEEVLELIASSEAGVPQLLAFLALTDRLDQRISAARERAAEQSSDEHWTRLAYLLRAKGDLSGAIEAASNSSDLLLRTNLLAEGRRWSQAADFAEDLYRRNEGRLEAAAFAATYQRLAGNAAEHERVMKALLKAANVERLTSGQADKPADPFGEARATNVSASQYWTAAKTLLINERPMEAVTILQKTIPRFAHTVLTRQKRHREALDLVGVKKDEPLDRRWFDKLPSPSGDAAFQFNHRLLLAMQIARQLRELGMMDELEQLLQTMRMAEGPQSENVRRLLILAMVNWQLGRQEDAVKDAAATIGAGFTPQTTFVQLIGRQAALAAFWYEHLVVVDPNADRQQAVGKALFMAVSQPRRGKPPDDWRQLVAAAHSAALKLPTQQRVHRLILIGQTCQVRGDLELARRFFAEAAEIEPAAGIRSGDLALADSQWLMAAKFYSAARSATSDAVLNYLYGYALTKSGATEAGDKQMRLARLMALSPDARLALAAALQERGLKQAAADELELVLRTALCDSPQMANAANNLGLLLRQDEPDRAAECFEQRRLHALNLRGDYAEVESYLGAAHFIHRLRAHAALEEGDRDKVQAEVDACEAVWPADVGLVIELEPELTKAGMTAASNALFDRVYAGHQRVTEEFPKSAMHLNNTAWISARTQRKLGEALALAERAVELAPDESAYHDTLAEVHFQRGEREAAVAAAQKCVELAPDNKVFAARLKHFQEDELKTLDRMEAN